ncbi:MAG: CAP domain-containing protein [Lentilactobacillus diolivorans]
MKNKLRWLTLLALGTGMIIGEGIANPQLASAKAKLRVMVLDRGLVSGTYKIKAAAKHGYAYSAKLKKREWKLAGLTNRTFKAAHGEFLNVNGVFKTYYYIRDTKQPKRAGWVNFNYLKQIKVGSDSTKKPKPTKQEKPTSTNDQNNNSTSDSDQAQSAAATQAKLDKYFTADEQSQIAQLKQQADSIGNDTKSMYSQTPSVKGSFTPGQLSEGYLNSTLGWINFFRGQYGLSPLTDNSAWNTEAQYGAATLAAADQGLSHGLKGFSKPAFVSDTDWQRGADATNQSNLGQGVVSPYDTISQYLNDSGNDIPGHREWLLGGINQVGIGQVGDYNDLMVFNLHGDGSSVPSKPIEFPKQGLFPIDLAQDTRWSLSLPTQYQSGTQVKVGVTDNTTNKPVDVTNIIATHGGYGEFGTSISYKPNADDIKFGHSYTITISGVPGMTSDYTYTTKLFDLGIAPSNSSYTETLWEG